MEKTVYWHISIDRDRSVVRLTRTSAPYRKLTDVTAAHALIDHTLTDVDRKRHGLFLDLREAPSRNDPEFEVQLERLRKAQTATFKRTALLVKTASGLLHVKRLIQQDRTLNAAVFMSEAQAAR
ncbi:MAG TPA: hypothetical protein VNO21_07730, partial [Polyangiaceae bacterium]|nr:hypothetical protein [Polyangiaceae bacterium]